MQKIGGVVSGGTDAMQDWKELGAGASSKGNWKERRKGAKGEKRRVTLERGVLIYMDVRWICSFQASNKYVQQCILETIVLYDTYADGRLHKLHKEGEVERRLIGAQTDDYFRVCRI